MAWNKDEDTALVEFTALFRDQQSNTVTEWPGMKSNHAYWRMAAEHISNASARPKRVGVYLNKVLNTALMVRA